jgi:hypothetical protein
MRKYSAAVFMLVLGVICLGLHFWLGWQAFISDQEEHGSVATVSSYMTVWGRDVFENLQSEFLQLFFQFLLLAGAFRFFRIEAYEEDVEEVKAQLTRVEQMLLRNQDAGAK